nr:sepiapterin reductase-like [Lytechinus pictus]
MAATQVFDSKTFCIITGGSRGIGRAMAVTFSAKFGPGSTVVLTGRSTADLSETQRQVQAVAPGVNVSVVTADLANAGTLSESLSSLTGTTNPSDFQHVLLINNAASMNDMSRYMKQMTASDVDYVQQYFMLNLTSMLMLTSHFLRTFPKREGLRRTVVNITSLGAIKPMKTCGLYSTGKAAREMMVRTYVIEEPDVRFLNYSPGPVDTDMYREIINKSIDQEFREMMSDLEAKNVLLKPHQTAAKLAVILEGDDFESGAHVDYFDVPEKEENTSS